MKTFKEFNEQLNVKTLSVDELAKKHGKSVEYIKKQLKSGTKVESEHTTNKHDAEKIASAHIGEVPDYYIKLKKYVE